MQIWIWDEESIVDGNDTMDGVCLFLFLPYKSRYREVSARTL
jgi:hypothetical protein